MMIGQVAPHFSLYNTRREKVELKDHLGKKIVLVFFPAAWTSVCTKEMCSLRDDMASYTDLDALVFGISVDMPFALKHFKADQNIPFDLLSDFNKEVIQAYGVYRAEFALELKGVAERAVFIIGSDGTIQYRQVLENPAELPDFDAAKRVLETIH
jgi:glutaredoxin-dependent peroxiredoxin